MHITMNMPCVSIIIPCYNMGRYVEVCLDSVCRQSLGNIEAICIDDGSTDATGQILDRYQEKDGRIKVFHQPNRGVAAARNKGLEMATGRFIAFLDPDDFYPEDGTLELLYTKAVENGALICGGSFSDYNNETGKMRLHYAGDYEGYAFLREGFVTYRDYQFDFGYHRFLYDRAFLEENGIVFPLYIRFQDPPFFVRAMIAAERFYAIPNVVYRYRKGIQVSATAWPEPKLHDMMRGYLDDLTLSAQHGLEKLHGLTVRRFEEDSVMIPVLNSVQRGNETTKALLQSFSDGICPALLKKCGMHCPKGGYTLRHYKELDRPAALSRVLSKFRRVKSLIAMAVKDCFRNGPVHTVRVVVEKLTF